jgi:hypothetical protein
MTQDNNETANVEVTQNVEVQPERVENSQELVQQVTAEQLHELQVAAARQNVRNYKTGLTGFAKFNKASKPSMLWFEGKLITTEEHNKLSWETVHANNNVIRKAK